MNHFLETLSALDNDITLSVNAWSSPLSDALWRTMSDKEIWFPLYALIAALLLLKLGWRRGLVALLAVALTVLLCDQVSGLVKDWADRLRPCHDQGMLDRGLRVLERRGSLYGFFSAHSANAFGIAVTSLMFLKLSGRGALVRVYSGLICIWALMVSVSRVFVGKHFFGDVVVGIFAGYLIGLAVWRILRPWALKIAK